MNREICGGGGASIYPLIGDVTSTAGNAPVSVTGIQGIPVQQAFLSGDETMFFDNTLNMWVPRIIAPGDLPIATSTTFGVVKPDNTTVTIAGGVLSATGGSGLLLQTNSVNNGSQTKLNLVAGTNITLTDNGVGSVTVATSGNATGNHFISTGSTPGFTIDPVHAGTGATASIVGTDTAGMFTLNTGIGATGGIPFGITFAAGFAGPPAGFFYAANSNAGVTPTHALTSTSNIRLFSEAILTDSTTYQWFYMVIGF